VRSTRIKATYARTISSATTTDASSINVMTALFIAAISDDLASAAPSPNRGQKRPA
jgi:hypothetical protein